MSSALGNPLRAPVWKGRSLSQREGEMIWSLFPEHKREIYDRYGREGLTGAGRWSGGGPGMKVGHGGEGEGGRLLQQVLS